MIVRKLPSGKGAVVEVDAEEFEFLAMGLHAFIENNRANAENPEIPKTLVNEDTGQEASITDLFAGQHVAVSKMLDVMSEAWGYDPAVEG